MAESLSCTLQSNEAVIPLLKSVVEASLAMGLSPAVSIKTMFCEKSRSNFLSGGK